MCLHYGCGASCVLVSVGHSRYSRLDCCFTHLPPPLGYHAPHGCYLTTVYTVCQTSLRFATYEHCTLFFWDGGWNTLCIFVCHTLPLPCSRLHTALALHAHAATPFIRCRCAPTLLYAPHTYTVKPTLRYLTVARFPHHPFPHHVPTLLQLSPLLRGSGVLPGAFYRCSAALPAAFYATRRLHLRLPRRRTRQHRDALQPVAFRWFARMPHHYRSRLLRSQFNTTLPCITLLWTGDAFLRGGTYYCRFVTIGYKVARCPPTVLHHRACSMNARHGDDRTTPHCLGLTYTTDGTICGTAIASIRHLRVRENYPLSLPLTAQPPLALQRLFDACDVPQPCLCHAPATHCLPRLLLVDAWACLYHPSDSPPVHSPTCCAFKDYLCFLLPWPVFARCS